MKKEMQALIALATLSGWRVENTRNGHVRFVPADKGRNIVIGPGTPSDHRALKNFKSELRRSGLLIP